MIPGIDGHPSLLQKAAPLLFAQRGVYYFNHRHLAAAAGGPAEQAARVPAEQAVGGLAHQAMLELPTGVGPVIVCGESFGGLVALQIAIDHPNRVSALVLFSAFARYPRGALRQVAPLWLRAWDHLGGAARRLILATWRPFSMLSAISILDAPGYAWAYLRKPLPDPIAYGSKLGITVEVDLRESLAAVRCPALMIAATGDVTVASSASDELHRLLLDRSRLERVQGGHLAHIVHAEAVGRIIADWLAHVCTDPAELSV